MAQTFAARISYVGTAYCGWQEQAHEHPQGLPSVQEVMQAALAEMAQEKAYIHASGRTDAGVHALGQVIHYKLERRPWEAEVVERGLNALLPQDIRILRVRSVADDFHSQFGAEKKQYGYYFLQGPTDLPHLKPYAYWIRRPLNLEAMHGAAQALLGEHDFAPFQAADGNRKTTVRRIFEARVVRQAVTFPSRDLGTHSLLKFEIVGSGFLKQMVRGLAGTLLQVGDGRRPSTCMAEILASGRRVDVGATAPARGLWLEHVWYPESVDI
jgi:tRNA pseudouridine38-40 synthase